MLTQCPVLYLAQLDATEQKSGKPLTLPETVSNAIRKRIWYFVLLLRSWRRSTVAPREGGQRSGSRRTAPVELMEMSDSSARQRLSDMNASLWAFQLMATLLPRTPEVQVSRNMVPD